MQVGNQLIVCITACDCAIARSQVVVPCCCSCTKQSPSKLHLASSNLHSSAAAIKESSIHQSVQLPCSQLGSARQTWLKQHPVNHAGQNKTSRLVQDTTPLAASRVKSEQLWCTYSSTVLLHTTDSTVGKQNEQKKKKVCC